MDLSPILTVLADSDSDAAQPVQVMYATPLSVTVRPFCWHTLPHYLLPDSPWSTCLTHVALWPSWPGWLRQRCKPSWFSWFKQPCVLAQATLQAQPAQLVQATLCSTWLFCLLGWLGLPGNTARQIFMLLTQLTPLISHCSRPRQPYSPLSRFGWLDSTANQLNKASLTRWYSWPRQ